MNSVKTIENIDTVSYEISENHKLIKYEITSEENSINIRVKKNIECIMVAYLHMDINSKFNLNVELEENAKLTFYNVTTSSKNVDVNVTCTMNKLYSEFNNLSVVLAKDNANYHSITSVFHNEKSTISNVEIYAIASDTAKVILDNNATIKKGCSKAKAYQKAKGLTLSKHAMIKALPNLFIDEYDVIANHAASIGSLNPEDLFYLMSRGLPKEEASKIIIMGFINPLLGCIDDEQTKKIILENFLEKSNLNK